MRQQSSQPCHHVASISSLLQNMSHLLTPKILQTYVMDLLTGNVIVYVLQGLPATPADVFKKCIRIAQKSSEGIIEGIIVTTRNS